MIAGSRRRLHDEGVKFGIFFEQQLPRPWGRFDEHRLFKDVLSQIELADRLGYDHVWMAEHHFLEEFSHSPAPEVVLGAASQRTTRIRLGHGITHLTTAHPARVAERIATLDLVSDGRVEFGMGAGSTTTELDPFGVEFGGKREMWEEAVRCLIPMLTKPTSEFHGRHWDFPARNVVPKPLQQPHPPLWVACSQLETIRKAGGWGLGVLGFQFLTPHAAQAWVSAYYDEYLRRPNRIAAYQPNPNIAICSYFMCCPTDGEAWEKAEEATFFEFALGSYRRLGPWPPGEVSLWDEYLRWKKTGAGEARSRWVRDHALVGSPATIRTRLEELEAMHIDQVILLAQTARTAHEDICASLELFGETLEEFHDRDADHRVWKTSVLEGSLPLLRLGTASLHRQVVGLGG